MLDVCRVPVPVLLFVWPMYAIGHVVKGTKRGRPVLKSLVWLLLGVFAALAEADALWLAFAEHSWWAIAPVTLYVVLFIVSSLYLIFFGTLAAEE